MFRKALLFFILLCPTLLLPAVCSSPSARGTVYRVDHLVARGLGPFFEKLRRLERGERMPVRILFFGDSIISGDNLTSQLRRRFQQRFGDGGPGIVNIVDRKYSRLRHSRNLTGGGFRLHFIPFGGLSLPDYPNAGFLGQAVEPLGPAVAVQQSQRPAERVRLILRAGPAGAASQVVFFGGTGREERSVELAPDECRLMEFTGNTTDTVRLAFQPLRGRVFVDAFVLENASGVTLSPVINLGLHQAWMQGVLDHSFECGFRLFDPDLVVYQSGINEAATMRNRRANYTMEMYPVQLDAYYAKLARLAPERPVLIVAPTERLIPGRGGLFVQPEVAPVREHQRRIAAERGQAFFDTYGALGGAGQMAAMMRAGEAHGDATHISFRGGERLSGLIFDALMAAFERYK